MGGVILRFADWEWHVLALCRGDDPDRAPRFARAAAALNAQPYISDLDDSSPIPAPLSADLHEIKRRISSLVPRDFDLIFTHGATGEYTRHERHEQIHRAVREMIESGELAGDLICFAYDDCEGRCRPQPAADVRFLVELTPEEHAAKQRIVRDIYGVGPGSFEFEAAGPIEAFSSPVCPVFRDFGDPISPSRSTAEIPKHRRLWTFDFGLSTSGSPRG